MCKNINLNQYPVSVFCFFCLILLIDNVRSFSFLPFAFFINHSRGCQLTLILTVLLRLRRVVSTLNNDVADRNNQKNSNGCRDDDLGPNYKRTAIVLNLGAILHRWAIFLYGFLFKMRLNQTHKMLRFLLMCQMSFLYHVMASICG